jgi:SAM-dependent methyltransferase
MSSEKKLEAASTGVEVACPICGSDQPRPLFWTKDYVFGCTEDSFRVNRCASCGCGYLSPRPGRDVIDTYYPPEFYWAWEGEKGEPDWPTIIARRREQLEEKAKWLRGIPPGRLLDIGAQKGEFLWFMQQRGWQAEGIELDNQVPNPARMPITYGDFLKMDLEEGQYDVVTFWAVLEHVYDPAVFVKKATTLLKPGGHLIAVVTNLNSIQSRFYQADDYPRHLTIFTKGSVSRLCKDAGLRLRRVHTGQEIFGGSLNGGLLDVITRLFGYSTSEALAEWRQFRDPDLFWCRWRGKNSFLIKSVSRVDRLASFPLEYALDRLGFGQILTFSAERPSK